MTNRSPQEIEAKLAAPREAVLSAIAQFKRLERYRLRPRQTVSLHTVYVDTSDFTLARHGIALRLRRTGKRWEMSAKWSGRRDGVVRTRPELTVRLAHPPSYPFTLPPSPLASQLTELIGEQRLSPILISDVRRQRLAVHVAGRVKGPAFAELALDRVRLRAPGPGRRVVATYCEVEIELESGGTMQDLLHFTELLQQRFALTPADVGKFSRGLRLLYGPGLFEEEDAEASTPVSS